jgi:hypothetical protein
MAMSAQGEIANSRVHFAKAKIGLEGDIVEFRSVQRVGDGQ